VLRSSGWVFSHIPLGREARVLGPEAAQLVVGRGRVAVPREGRRPVLPGRLPPGPDGALGDAEPAGHLGNREPLVGEHLQGLELELARVGLAGHWCSPPSEFTPLTWTPRLL